MNGRFILLVLLLAAPAWGQEPGDRAAGGEEAVDVEAETLARLEREAAERPAEREPLFRLAHYRYQRDEFAAAEALFAGSLERHGPHPYARYMLGAIAERRFLYAAAQDHYAGTLALDPAHRGALEGVERTQTIAAALERFRASHRRAGRDLALVLIVATLVFVALLGSVRLERPGGGVAARTAPPGPPGGPGAPAPQGRSKISKSDGTTVR